MKEKGAGPFLSLEASDCDGKGKEELVYQTVRIYLERTGLKPHWLDLTKSWYLATMYATGYHLGHHIAT